MTEPVNSQQAKLNELNAEIEEYQHNLNEIRKKNGELEEQLKTQSDPSNENSIENVCNQLEQLAKEGKYNEILQKKEQIESLLTNPSLKAEFDSIVKVMSTS